MQDPERKSDNPDRQTGQWTKAPPNGQTPSPTRKEVGQPDRQTDWTADKGAPKRTDKEPDPKKEVDNRTGQTDWTTDNSAPKQTGMGPKQKRKLDNQTS